MRRKYIETGWTFQADGRPFTGHRDEHNNMTVYTIDDQDNVTLMFTDKHLGPLRAFLAAMDAEPGIKVIRCRFCDEEIDLRGNPVDGLNQNKPIQVHGIDGIAGWFCEDNPNDNVHEPRPDEYEDEDEEES